MANRVRSLAGRAEKKSGVDDGFEDFGPARRFRPGAAPNPALATGLEQRGLALNIESSCTPEAARRESAIKGEEGAVGIAGFRQRLSSRGTSSVSSFRAPARCVAAVRPKCQARMVAATWRDGETHAPQGGEGLRIILGTR